MVWDDEGNIIYEGKDEGANSVTYVGKGRHSFESNSPEKIKKKKKEKKLKDENTGLHKNLS